jgi:hypothetical protein
VLGVHDVRGAKLASAVAPVSQHCSRERGQVGDLAGVCARPTFFLQAVRDVLAGTQRRPPSPARRLSRDPDYCHERVPCALPDRLCGESIAPRGMRLSRLCIAPDTHVELVQAWQPHAEVAER